MKIKSKKIVRKDLSPTLQEYQNIIDNYKIIFFIKEKELKFNKSLATIGTKLSYIKYISLSPLNNFSFVFRNINFHTKDLRYLLMVDDHKYLSKNIWNFEFSNKQLETKFSKERHDVKILPVIIEKEKLKEKNISFEKNFLEKSNLKRVLEYFIYNKKYFSLKNERISQYIKFKNNFIDDIYKSNYYKKLYLFKNKINYINNNDYLLNSNYNDVIFQKNYQNLITKFYNTISYFNNKTHTLINKEFSHEKINLSYAILYSSFLYKIINKKFYNKYDKNSNINSVTWAKKIIKKYRNIFKYEKYNFIFFNAKREKLFFPLLPLATNNSKYIIKNLENTENEHHINKCYTNILLSSIKRNCEMVSLEDQEKITDIKNIINTYNRKNNNKENNFNNFQRYINYFKTQQSNSKKYINEYHIYNNEYSNTIDMIRAIGN